MLSSAFSERPKFFCTRPSNQLYLQNQHKQVLFWDQENFAFRLQATIQVAVFIGVLPKTSFKKLLLGTGLWQHAKMRTSLKSLDGLKNAECKKSCWATGRPYHTYLWLTSSPPRKKRIFSRSSFQTRHTLVCPFTHVGTMRNILHTLLQPSESSIKRGCPRSVGCLPRLLWSGLRHWRISKKLRVLKKLSWWTLMFKPARWILSRPNRCLL